jgi:hypothetical protein
MLRRLAFHFQDNLQSIVLYMCRTLGVNEYLPPAYVPYMYLPIPMETNA